MRAFFPFTLEIVGIAFGKIKEASHCMYAARPMKSHFQKANFLRFTSWGFGNVFKKMEQCLGTAPLCLGDVDNFVPRNLLPNFC